MNNCPVCYAGNDLPEALMGVFGTAAQLRCRYCGCWWSVNTDDIDLDLENDDDE